MFENRITNILSSDDDVAINIIQVCKNVNENGGVLLAVEIQERIMNRLLANSLEEEVWDMLLSVIDPKGLSEKVLNYLIQNNISLLRLCHMQLQDKWLIKLLEYDEAPLYTLSKRFYLSKEYSSIDFLEFYNHYLFNKSDLSLYLLELFEDSDKRSLLLFLCLINEEFKYREYLEWHQVSDRVRCSTYSEEIVDIYNAYRNNGIVLSKIATNYFTPNEILLELLSVKGIKYASQIRRSSEKTLKLKQSIKQ